MLMLRSRPSDIRPSLFPFTLNAGVRATLDGGLQDVQYLINDTLAFLEWLADRQAQSTRPNLTTLHPPDFASFRGALTV